MKKTIYYCDLCGKEILDKHPQNYIERIRITQLPLFSCSSTSELEMELCRTCRKRLYDFIEKMKKESEAENERA